MTILLESWQICLVRRFFSGLILIVNPSHVSVCRYRREISCQSSFSIKKPIRLPNRNHSTDFREFYFVICYLNSQIVVDRKQNESWEHFLTEPDSWIWFFDDSADPNLFSVFFRCTGNLPFGLKFWNGRQQVLNRYSKSNIYKYLARSLHFILERLIQFFLADDIPSLFTIHFVSATSY